MNRDDELSRIRNVADAYGSDELAGANERYHIHVRDTLIPEAGGKTALELGCGKGLWTKVLSERYDKVDIVDGSDELLEKVRAENESRRADIAIHHALVEDFVADSHSHWDHIYLTFLLEHLDNPVAVLKGIHRLLDDGGQLFIAVPNALSVHRMVALRMGMIDRADELEDKLRVRRERKEEKRREA